MPSAIIVGSEGQDGRLLYRHLAGKNYGVVGVGRGSTRSTGSDWVADVDISDFRAVSEAVRSLQPDEIYYLAAYHHASEDDSGDNRELYRRSFDVHVHYLVNFLEAIRRYSSATKLFYAGSSHVFGEPASEYQDESTPINPVCAYGISKAAGIHTCRFYRDTHSVFASVGILYNHESSLRDERFVSQKIIRGAINIKNGNQRKLVLGDLHAVVDWGYAPDYVEAMHRILLHNVADDFVIATGAKHTVRDFVDATFGFLDMDWRKYVATDALLLKKRPRTLVGKPDKIYKATGWRARTDFGEMVNHMVKEQLAGNFR